MNELTHDQFKALYGRIDALQAKGYMVTKFSVSTTLGNLYVYVEVEPISDDPDQLEAIDLMFAITREANVWNWDDAPITPPTT